MDAAPEHTQTLFMGTSSAAATTTSLRALVIDPNLPHVLLAVGALSGSGFEVTVAENFSEARQILNHHRPAVLVAEIRLGDYNGLHLVLVGKTVRPDMTAIVTSWASDSTLRAEAERMGATFVPKPTTQQELQAAVFRTMFREDPARAIQPPFERRQDARRGRAVEPPAGVERRLGDRRRPPSALLGSVESGRG